MINTIGVILWYAGFVPLLISIALIRVPRDRDDPIHDVPLSKRARIMKLARSGEAIDDPDAAPIVKRFISWHVRMLSEAARKRSRWSLIGAAVIAIGALLRGLGADLSTGIRAGAFPAILFAALVGTSLLRTRIVRRYKETAAANDWAVEE